MANDEIVLPIKATWDAAKAVTGLNELGATLGSVATKVLNLAFAFGEDLYNAIAKGVKEAAEAEENIRMLNLAVENANTRFGEAVGSSEQWGEAVDRLTGQLKIYSDDAVSQAVTQTINLTSRFGLNQEQMESLVGVAGNLAAAYNMDLGQATQALTQGMMGMERSTRQLGIALDEETMQTYLDANAHGVLWKELTETEKAQVRYNVILEQTAGRMDSATAASETYTGASKMFSNAIDELYETLGTALLPILADFYELLTNLATNAMPYVAQASEMIAGVMQYVFQVTQSYVEYFTDTPWDQIFFTILFAVSDVFQEVAFTIAEWLGQVVATIVEFVGTGGEGSGAIGVFWRAGWDAIYRTFANIWAEMYNAVADVINNIIVAIGDWLNNIYSMVPEKIRSMLGLTLVEYQNYMIQHEDLLTEMTDDEKASLDMLTGYYSNYVLLRNQTQETADEGMQQEFQSNVNIIQQKAIDFTQFMGEKGTGGSGADAASAFTESFEKEMTEWTTGDLNAVIELMSRGMVNSFTDTYDKIRDLNAYEGFKMQEDMERMLKEYWRLFNEAGEDVANAYADQWMATWEQRASEMEASVADTVAELQSQLETWNSMSWTGTQNQATSGQYQYQDGQWYQTMWDQASAQYYQTMMSNPPTPGAMAAMGYQYTYGNENPWYNWGAGWYQWTGSGYQPGSPPAYALSEWGMTALTGGLIDALQGVIPSFARGGAIPIMAHQGEVVIPTRESGYTYQGMSVGAGGQVQGGAQGAVFNFYGLDRKTLEQAAKTFRSMIDRREIEHLGSRR